MREPLIFFFLYAFAGMLYSLYQNRTQHTYFGLSYVLIPLGAFVWIDGVVLGVFWTIVSLFLLILNNPTITLLVFALFWTVRSAGEVLYWFLEQFASKKRNPPPTLFLYRFFPNESVWIVMQLLWQCILVCSLVADMLLIKRL